MLLLKRHLVDLVRRGKKRQTIRLWTRPLLRPNQVSYTPGLGKMRILSVDQLPSLRALTEQDARLDGFDSLAGLLAEIARIYGRRPPAGKKIYRITFEWPIDPAGQQLVIPAAPAATPAPASPPRASSPPPSSRRARAVRATSPRSRIARPESPRPATAARARSTGMSAPQREALRAFIVSRKPA